ncbi:unnamed protein product [Rhizoctonia solani]|uniref:Uncharacterized protein n=1 Tax=Rhizoctonia solani TaxID=456999 RepID=A0A8H3HLB1_9AGAM|nr:unnamed protein product [Rhizoctonia solani]
MTFSLEIRLQLGERILRFHRDADSTSVHYVFLVQCVNEESSWWLDLMDFDQMTRAVIYIVKSTNEEVTLGKLQSGDVKFEVDRSLIRRRYPVQNHQVDIRVQVVGSASTRTAPSVDPKPTQPVHGRPPSASSRSRKLLPARSASGPVTTQAPGVTTSNSHVSPPVARRVASLNEVIKEPICLDIAPSSVRSFGLDNDSPPAATSAPDPQKLTSLPNIDLSGSQTLESKPDQDSALDHFIEVARYCARGIKPKPPQITNGHFYETLEAEKTLSLKPLITAETTWKDRFTGLERLIEDAKPSINWSPVENTVGRWHQNSQKWAQLTEEQRQEYRPKPFKGLKPIADLLNSN